MRRDAPLLPIQPLLLTWFRQAYSHQQETLVAERSTRQRLGLQSSKHESSSGSDGAAAAVGADFAFFRWLLQPRLEALETALQDIALIDASSVHKLFVAAEAAHALAGLLRAAASHGVYRPREDASGEQRALISAALEPAIRMATSMSTYEAAAVGEGAIAGRYAAIGGACATLDALIILDSLMVRPRLEVVIALIASNSGDASGG